MISLKKRGFLLKHGMAKGENPVRHVIFSWRNIRIPRVALFGTTELHGWYIPSEAQYLLEPDSEEVP